MSNIEGGVDLLNSEHQARLDTSPVAHSVDAIPGLLEQAETTGAIQSEVKAPGARAVVAPSCVGSEASEAEGATLEPETITAASGSKRARPEPEPKTRSSSRPRKKSQASMSDKDPTGSQLQATAAAAAAAGREMEELHTKTASLLDKASKLEMLVQEKDAELMRMRQLLHSKNANQASTSVSEQELKQAYCNSVQSLKDYIAVCNLLNYDITGKNLPDKITQDLKQLIHQISKVCLQAIKPDTPFVLDVIAKDYTQASQADWELDRSHWINVIAQLQLTDAQVVTILKSRDAHVMKMMSLFHERATYMRQAAELAVSAASSDNGRMLPMMQDNPSTLGVLMRHGYLYCAKNMVTINKLLEAVKESLLKEQKTVMELFLKVVYQILSPVQAALFVTESFPYHCDVLALANVLCSVVGKDVSLSFQSGPSNSLGGFGGMGSMDSDMMGMMGSAGSGGMQGQSSLGGGVLSMGGGGGFSNDLGGGPGSLGGMNMGGSTGPSSDGLARLKSFIETAGMAAGLNGMGNNTMRSGSMGGSGGGASMGNGDGMTLQGLGQLHGHGGLDGGTNNMLLNGRDLLGGGAGTSGNNGQGSKMRSGMAPSLLGSSDQNNLGLGSGMGGNMPMASPWSTSAAMAKDPGAMGPGQGMGSKLSSMLNAGMQMSKGMSANMGDNSGSGMMSLGGGSHSLLNGSLLGSLGGPGGAGQGHNSNNNGLSGLGNSDLGGGFGSNGVLGGLGGLGGGMRMSMGQVNLGGNQRLAMHGGGSNSSAGNMGGLDLSSGNGT